SSFHKGETARRGSIEPWACCPFARAAPFAAWLTASAVETAKADREHRARAEPLPLNRACPSGLWRYPSNQRLHRCFERFWDRGTEKVEKAIRVFPAAHRCVPAGYPGDGLDRAALVYRRR